MPISTQSKGETVERYALLHRAVESGEANDATRRQLVRACVQLGKRAEAVQSFHAIENPVVRRACRHDLARLGWVSPENDADELRSLVVTDAMLNPSLREKVEDAVHLVCDPRLRIAVLAGTMAFPLVLGVGGALTSGGPFFLRCALALVPALVLLGMLGSLARHVLVMAIEERDAMDGLPSPRQLVRETWRSLADIGVLGAVLLGPPALAVWLNSSLPGLLLLAVAGFLGPMTVALRLSGAEWRSLTPLRVVTAIRRLTPPYPGVACATSLLLAPAVLVLTFSSGMEVFLTFSVVGPLAVVPALMAARILGLTLHYERARLGDLFALPLRPHPETAATGSTGASTR